jgi:hypothetical protein
MENKHKILVALLVCVIAFGTYSVGYYCGFNSGSKAGVEITLDNLREMLAGVNIRLEWKDMGNGQYNVSIISSDTGELLFNFTSVFHLLTEHYRPYGNLNLWQKAEALTNVENMSFWLTWIDLDNDGTLDAYNGIYPGYNYEDCQYLISQNYHAMTTVNQGLDWIEQQLFNTNETQKALYLACSNTTDSVSTAWTEIPDEITTDGLARALGAYVSTGTGQANVSKTFSVSGTNSTRCYGVYYDSYTSTKTSLVSAEQQGDGAQKNMVNGDSLALTAQWQGT